MDPIHVAILVVAGLCGGFIAGLVGVGGGIVFAPILLFYFQATGADPATVAPLTIGTSLLCTLMASSISARQHHLNGAVRWDVSLRVGLLSAAALYAIVEAVTTQDWYDRFAFQLVFGALLLLVSAQMTFSKNGDDGPGSQANSEGSPTSWLQLGGIGSAAGAIAALAGVGGGVLMVPAYHQILRLPIQISVGTSSASIVVISTVGVLTYALTGWSEVEGILTLGYVDVIHGLLLAVPAIPGARAGARLAHRIPRRGLRISFAVIAAVVAGRMLVSAIQGL